MTRDEIFDRVSRTLVEMFELDPRAVTMEAGLFQELGLDSIDAVDLAARLQELTGRRLAEDDLRKIRTIGDVVDVVDRMLGAEG